MPTYKHKSTQDWKPVPGRILKGRVEERGSLVVDKKDRPFITVQAEDGFWRLYESKALEDVFNLAQVRDWVEIEFLGKVALVGGRTFNRFRTAVYQLDSGEAPPFQLSNLAPKPVTKEDVEHAAQETGPQDAGNEGASLPAASSQRRRA